ncbi:MAG: SIMPL domain-containing protein [Brotaphodocola sp.]
MEKKMTVVLAGCLLGTAVLLSACQSAPQVVIPDVIQVQEADGADGKISLTSSETVEVVPDMAEITYGVRTEDSDAGTCQQKNAKQVESLLAYFKENGFEDHSIKTSGFSLNPRYDWSSDNRKLIGYEMQTTVVITDVPMDQAGKLLSEAMTKGANEIYGVSYFSSSYDKAYQEALTKAVELARGNAEALAAASGKALGGVLSIEEHKDNQYGRYVNGDLSMNQLSAGAVKAEAAVTDMAVEPGELQVTADISIVFEMTEK